MKWKILIAVCVFHCVCVCVYVCGRASAFLCMVNTGTFLCEYYANVCLYNINPTQFQLYLFS